MITRITSVTVLPEGEPIYCDRATTIKIDDEAAGEFLIIQQCHDNAAGKISIEPAEWPFIRDAIDKMIESCK